eukprot:1138963-Pelagomonas_calceolata.AAC.10
MVKFTSQRFSRLSAIQGLRNLGQGPVKAAVAPAYLERQKARAEREAAQAAEEAGVAGDAPSAPQSNTDAPPLPPYAGDLLTLDQLLTCLRKLLPADDKTSTQQGEKKALEVPAGAWEQRSKLAKGEEG